MSLKVFLKPGNQDQKEKGKEPMFQEKVERLQKMKIKNHRDFLKELVAVEFRAMGIITKTRSRLVEIEAQNKKKNIDEVVPPVRLPAKIKTPEEQKDYLERWEVIWKKHRLEIKKPPVVVPAPTMQNQKKKDKKNSNASSILEPTRKIMKTQMEMVENNRAQPTMPREQRLEVKKPSVVVPAPTMQKRKKKGKENSNASLILEPTRKRMKTQMEMEEDNRAQQPTLPRELQNAIREHGGHNVEWVITKTLTATDVNPNHQRLSIPGKQAKSLEKFLTGTEKREKITTSVDVLVWVIGAEEEPELRKSLGFQKWEMSSSFIYVLKTKWKQLVEEKGLRNGDTVQIWSFRGPQYEGNKLCFAIYVPRR